MQLRLKTHASILGSLRHARIGRDHTRFLETIEDPVASSSFSTRASSAEFLGLLYAVRAIGAEDSPCLLQFVGCTPGSGTTTVSRGFAQAAALQADQRVLVIDCNAPSSEPEPTLVEVFRQRGMIDEAIRPSACPRGFDSAVLSNSPNALLDISVDDLQRVLDLARAAHSYAILDCPSIVTDPGAAALGRLCDATILVIEAQTTSRAAIAAAREQISRLGGRVLGCILNQKCDSVPSWLTRLS